jgi:hypothetical protein
MDYVINAGPLKAMPEQTGPLKTKFIDLAGQLGSYVTHAKLTESNVADIYIYQHYFVAYQTQPISIRIKYYKPSKVWICQGIQFDTELPELIQKAADEKLFTNLK